MTALILLSTGSTKRNQASKDNVCDWTDQLVRSLDRALHRYRRGRGFKSRTGLNVFFRSYFHYCSSGVHYFGDLFHIHVFIRSSNIWLSYIHSRLFTTSRVYLEPTDQLSVGLLAQLVERCTGIAEVMGSNPVQAWIFFRPYFHYYSSSVHNCEDRFHIHVQVLLLTDRLWSVYTLLRDRNLIFQPFVLILKA